MDEQEQEQTQTEGEQTQPKDLAEAMSALRENNAESTEESVDGRGDTESEAGQDTGGERRESGNEQDQSDSAEIQSGQGDASIQGQQLESAEVYEPSGGSPVAASGDDYASARQNLLDSIGRQAQIDATAEFQKNDIQKINVNRLYQQDPDTGRVSFINPDDVRQDGRGNQTFGEFASRAEAQAWCNAFNEQIDQQYRQTIAEKQNEYLDQMMPAVRLLDFAPTFNKLSADEQKTMDTLIAPYGVYDADNHLIGFNCDLDAAANQAKTIAAQYGSRKATAVAKETEVAKAKSGPATDAKTKGSASANKSTEPKNMEDAMRMLKEENAAKRANARKGKK